MLNVHVYWHVSVHVLSAVRRVQTICTGAFCPAGGFCQNDEINRMINPGLIFDAVCSCQGTIHNICRHSLSEMSGGEDIMSVPYAPCD
jgi:hypothetical protein